MYQANYICKTGENRQNFYYSMVHTVWHDSAPNKA